MKKYGTISIIGRPNVGKSTLINAILKQKLSIVSYKPQTTRNKIIGLYENNKMKVNFIDTPGFHKPANKLDVFLNSEVKSSIKNSDITMWLIDSNYDKLSSEDHEIAKLIESYKINNVFVVLTKKDKNKENFATKILSELPLKPMHALHISSLNNNDIGNLCSELYNFLPLNATFEMHMHENDEFVICEIIREQLLLELKQEVPHGCAVVIDQKNYDKDENIFYINASINVEKESQKPIIIGKGGHQIKTIGTKSRHELLKIYDCRVDLRLFVKVQKNWRDDESMLKKLGYYKK